MGLTCAAYAAVHAYAHGAEPVAQQRRPPIHRFIGAVVVHVKHAECMLFMGLAYAAQPHGCRTAAEQQRGSPFMPTWQMM